MKPAQTITRIIDFFYIKPFSMLMPRQTFRYAVCGGANLVLNWVLYFVVFHFVLQKRNIDLGFYLISSHIATLCIVFVVTFFTGFWLNRNVAFPGSPLRSINQLIRYGLSVAGSFVISYVLMKIFVEGCGFYPTPSNILTSMICVVYSYLASRFFTFRGARKE
ncbi:MAG: GtrA family protein [Rikenellaceae bacterium]|nr:GtrA family protein [Rikenellaceae bacterium]